MKFILFFILCILHHIKGDSNKFLLEKELDTINKDLLMILRNAGWNPVEVIGIYTC